VCKFASTNENENAILAVACEHVTDGDTSVVHESLLLIAILHLRHTHYEENAVLASLLGWVESDIEVQHAQLLQERVSLAEYALVTAGIAEAGKRFVAYLTVIFACIYRHSYILSTQHFAEGEDRRAQLWNMCARLSRNALSYFDRDYKPVALGMFSIAVS
jgi:hypothetical protein